MLGATLVQMALPGSLDARHASTMIDREVTVQDLIEQLLREDPSIRVAVQGGSQKPGEQDDSTQWAIQAILISPANTDRTQEELEQLEERASEHLLGSI